MNIYNVHKDNPDTFTQLSLKDQLFLYYNCPQKDQIIQLYSNYNQLAFTISGGRIFHHDDKKWRINNKYGFLMKRGAFLQEIPTDYSEWNVLAMYLKDDYLKGILEEFRPYINMAELPEVDPYMIQEIKLNDQIRNCCKSLLPYFGTDQTLPDSIFESKFKELLFNILIHPSNKQVLAYVNQIADDYVTPVWQVMETNFMYSLSISEFAEIANRSIATFRRDFETHYHTSPGKWLTNRRLKRAASLLSSSDKPVSDIVFNCGFKNISHFSRVFKEKYSLSPSEYRSNQR